MRPSRCRERDLGDQEEGESPYSDTVRCVREGWRGVGMREREKCEDVSGE